MGAHDGFMMCRRFNRLRARLLLLKQDRISCLEEQLDQIDHNEPLPLFLGKSRGDSNSERISILSQLDSALADYGMLARCVVMGYFYLTLSDSYIERTRQVLGSVSGSVRDNTSLRNWLVGTACVSRQETAYLNHEDLISLASPSDRATSQLEVWIEDALIKYCPGFRTV
jgi:hypothetical protein